tara:strand:+ start:765 stop:908 length:144 start_codon:yes stop_codon:yes gene_type:complete
MKDAIKGTKISSATERAGGAPKEYNWPTKKKVKGFKTFDLRDIARFS